MSWLVRPSAHLFGADESVSNHNFIALSFLPYPLILFSILMDDFVAPFSVHWHISILEITWIRIRFSASITPEGLSPPTIAVTVTSFRSCLPPLHNLQLYKNLRTTHYVKGPCDFLALSRLSFILRRIAFLLQACQVWQGLYFLFPTSVIASCCFSGIFFSHSLASRFVHLLLYPERYEAITYRKSEDKET